MFLDAIQCGAELGNGSKCEETANVVDLEFIYRKEIEEGRFQQVVDEIRYTMECPKCGRWTRVKTAHTCCTIPAA